MSRPAAGAPLALELDESRSGTYRPQLSDHSRMREIAELKLDGGRFAVEFLLEVDPPIAIATHKRDDRPWSDDTTMAHLAAWREMAWGASTAEAKAPAADEADEAAARQQVLNVLWPVVLGDRLIDEVAGWHAHDGRAVHALVQAVLSSQWAAKDAGSRGWNPSVQPTTVEDADATMLEAARRRSHIRAARALGAVARGPASVSEAILPWMLRRLPEGIEPTAIVKALLEIPPQHATATSNEALIRALSSRAASDVTLVSALLGFANGSLSLWNACSALRGPADVPLLMRVVTRKVMPHAMRAGVKAGAGVAPRSSSSGLIP